MKIEVKVTSEEIIKPSSQTPDHLRHYTLSYLDQMSPKMYNPLILFYELNEAEMIGEMSSRMKKSLSEVLALYYPLAGRVRDDRFVECNDEGISFSEARISSPNKLSEVMKNPNPNELAKFLPFDVIQTNEFTTGIRLNTFSSGRGVAVGICVSHQLGDGLSLAVFLKSWAALSRFGSAATIESPQFVSAELFPPQNIPIHDYSDVLTTEVTSKMFSFSSPAIEAIRAKYIGYNSTVTRVEALSVFLISRLLSLTRLDGRERVVVADHPVNLRPKLDHPLPESSFGNLFREAYTFLGRDGGDDGVVIAEGDIVERIREGIRKVDKEFVRKIREFGEDESFKNVIEEMTRVERDGGEFLVYSLSSMRRFPFYETDFGFGEPLWISPPVLSFENDVLFLDSKHGDGIETYVSLKPEIMAKLEVDVELLKYATLSL